MTVSSESVCDRCGAFGGMPHQWHDDDCLLGHAAHEPRDIGLICRRHYGWINDTLNQIVELFALLPDVLEPSSGASDHRGGSVFSPAPGRLDVMAITDRRAKTPVDLEPGDVPDLPGSLSSWAGWAWGVRGGDPIDDTVTGAVRYLQRERYWIAQQPEVPDYVDELAFLHRSLASAVGDTMWPRPIGKCPGCGRNLYNTIGVDEVTCRRCKETWTGLDLVRLRLIHEQEATG